MNEGWTKPSGTAISSSVRAIPRPPVQLLTVIDGADQDCGETENDEGNKDTLDGILDEPQGLSRVEEELNQKSEGV